MIFITKNVSLNRTDKLFFAMDKKCVYSDVGSKLGNLT